MENFCLLVSGKKSYWFPVGGFLNADVVGFRPRISSDNVANHLIIDGGPQFDYSGFGNIMKSDWFDLEWEMTDIGGASVRPGKPKVPDITEWEKYVSMPDLESLDWEACGRENAVYLGTNKMNQLGIYCGLWERMMSLMDVEEACIALVDDDLKPHTHRFLDAFCDFLIDFIRRVKSVCNIHSVLLHEDWAHQRAPFFSAETASEMLVPYVRRIADFCHANDIILEIHMCGAVEKLLPPLLETDADMWSAIQPLLYDTAAIVKRHKDHRFVWGITAPLITPDYSEEDMRQAAKDFVEEYKDCNIMVSYFSLEEGFPGFHPGLQDAIYEYSRIAFEDYED
jgi:hypothetical protein